MTDNVLSAVGLSYAFGELEVLSGIDLQVRRGEVVAIVGSSGCGKTTLLNLLAGFAEPTAGTITRRTTVRMVHQKDGLFPWLTVAQNVAMGLRHVADEKAKQARLVEALQLVGLQTFENHFPHQLSGGMRQRTEIARALVSQAETLLMDEPFSALDYMTRLYMRNELARLLLKMPRTVILVTHDVEEAAQLADRIILLSKRPAHIWKQIEISTARPRNVTQDEVVQTVRELLSLLNLESSNANTGPAILDETQ